MTQTAEVINFNRPVVKADKDDGFAPIAIRLAQALASTKMSSNQNRVVWAIVTKTYGWQKSFDWICNEQISDITATEGEHLRIPKNKVSEAKTALIKRKILIAKGREIGINPVVSEWLEKAQNPESGTEFESRNQDSIIPKSGQHNPEIRTKQSSKREPQKKETITKETYTKETPAKRGTKIPDNFSPSAEMLSWAKDKNFSFDVIAETENFILYWESEGKVKKDWSATWKMWMNNTQKRFGNRSGFTRQSNTKARPENFNAKDYGDDMVRY